MRLACQKRRPLTRRPRTPRSGRRRSTRTNPTPGGGVRHLTIRTARQETKKSQNPPNPKLCRHAAVHRAAGLPNLVPGVTPHDQGQRPPPRGRRNSLILAATGIRNIITALERRAERPSHGVRGWILMVLNNLRGTKRVGGTYEVVGDARRYSVGTSRGARAEPGYCPAGS